MSVMALTCGSKDGDSRLSGPHISPLYAINLDFSLHQGWLHRNGHIVQSENKTRWDIRE